MNFFTGNNEENNEECGEEILTNDNTNSNTDADKDTIESCPLEEVDGATAAERKRFLVARKGHVMNAADALTAHIKWREELPLPLPCHKLKYGKNQLPGTDELPGWIGMLTNPKTGEYIRSKKNNTKIVIVYGAMCDLDFDADDYIHATADFLHANLDNNHDEKFTILVDVRPGEGWKDPAPLQFIPLIQAINTQMSANYPERVQDIVIFPMPWWAVTIFNMVTLFMDPLTAEKMSMLAGPALIDSPEPDGLEEYVDCGVAHASGLQCYPHEFDGNTSNTTDSGIGGSGSDTSEGDSGGSDEKGEEEVVVEKE